MLKCFLSFEKKQLFGQKQPTLPLLFFFSLSKPHPSSHPIHPIPSHSAWAAGNLESSTGSDALKANLSGASPGLQAFAEGK